MLLSSSSFFIQENQHFIFIVQDITSINQKDNIIKEQNTKLRDISWYQSHLLRAPLAKILGIVKLLEDGIISDESEKEFFLKAIYESSTELDKVIHDIVNKT